MFSIFWGSGSGSLAWGARRILHWLQGKVIPKAQRSQASRAFDSLSKTDRIAVHLNAVRKGEEGPRARELGGVDVVEKGCRFDAARDRFGMGLCSQARCSRVCGSPLTASAVEQPRLTPENRLTHRDRTQVPAQNPI
ncbi:hypothetical protein SKAU_G00404520 [Synaphobranchus kaupii]|uniref:Uncharacterized protein n=1 Tax=Synaphobranchus kaupii TaxID=118154 RepID=A0A9Q1IAP7_SYNKA|nr:hypothetical protein SKAU_G00404520 [Synaphobranchus kaupii]